MAWYSKNGKDIDVALSSRIRLARNISDYPFASRLTAEAAREIADKAAPVFMSDTAKRVDFTSLTPSERGAYAEMHLVSPEFANRTDRGTLIVDDARSLAVMICEEDHIRL
nr:hypothetical protein [Clostridia bacterium]